MRIVVVGIGYVGLSLAVLLAQRHQVTAVDVNPERVRLVNARSCPLEDLELAEYLTERELDLHATTNALASYRDADVVVIATPTDYDPVTGCFDTCTVESVISAVVVANRSAVVVIKSTVPVGFTERLRKRHPDSVIVFSPEFLREGRALHDNLHPSRIVVGDMGDAGRLFADLMIEVAEELDVPILFVNPTEAEAIKLFANTYLALRVAYFNELDTYAAVRGLNAADIIEGVGLDPRVGAHYNNPSFGYGGYCLPKDTQQLLANYSDVPQHLIAAVVEANSTRKDFIAQDILRRLPSVVGIHRLAMKTGSDNFRESAVIGVMNRIRERGVEVIIFEPAMSESTYFGVEIVHDLNDFKRRSDIIVSNRRAPHLSDVSTKVYSRDVFGRD
ncbi:nucleotide sugar dehydrogenase [Tessaracoccus sp. MC1627]|uniref:nucleotide sugar dehydrogenase n=1 Tax=Tessaracoccus sp. MC1627 TaxID=2760312 RepID=UPI00160293E4|nr:nucleotide sugar dehydrogenase [Tessaracoccus sp. MC1627]MBB1512584.1 nucleotide sugar dehydrogenase [Tessaracoccus sp. MC1627]